MKTIIAILLALLTNLKASSQSDSILSLVKSNRLFLVVDSVSKQLQNSSKPIVLIFSDFGLFAQSSVIIWKDRKKYCGYYYRSVDGKLVRKKISNKKIVSTFPTRLLSEKCDLCKLLSGEHKSDIDHDGLMYLRRNTKSTCDEIFFTYSSLAYYEDPDSCVQDLRYLSF